MKHIYSIRHVALGLAAALLLYGCHQNEKGTAADTAGIVLEDTVTRTDTAASAVTAPVRCPDMQKRALKGSSLHLETEGLRLNALGGSLRHGGVYSVTSLPEEGLAPLPQGMVNLTASSAGYRLLPGGEHFNPAAELRIAYDPGRIPEGYTPEDIYTSYYDSTAMAWVRLERIGIDTASHEIVSLTTHFTDFINELLKAPEMPETQAFVPTAMSSLEAANPMEGMTLMQPPSPSQSGAAELNYPLDIPAGRNGMQPSLALTYNSGGGSGWLGDGWDIPIPSITIETRWGVPRYDSEKESEVYLYKGEQLVTRNVETGFRQMPHRTTLWHDRFGNNTQFFPRVNESFDSIVRHGSTPSEYWWEVYERTGVVHRYGHYETLGNDTAPSTLRDTRGNIARWCLAESEDPYGNLVRYLYDTVRYSGIDGSRVKGCQIYPAEIHYTLHRSQSGSIDDTGYHRIVFWREDNDHGRKHSYKVFAEGNHGVHSIAQQIPVSINGRNGFKEVTASLLSFVRIYSGDTTNRIYHFGMRTDRGTNYKVFLKNVSSSISPGIEGYTEKGVFYRGDAGGNWLNFDYIYAGDEVFGPEVVLDDEWQGSGYDNDVSVTGFVGGASEVLGNPLATTALSMSKGFSWNVGGGADVGFGFNIFMTELAAGGNYSYCHSRDNGLLSLIDLDVDGLADKVFKDIFGQIWYRRHIRLDNGLFVYGPAVKLSSIDNFQETTSHSHDVGLQVSLGVSATASRSWGKNYTTTYFSDVNADGLPDLVTDNGVYFNDLVGGIPTFSRAPYHSDPSVADTIRTSTMPCGYVIYDGELNDSIYCTMVIHDKDMVYEPPLDIDSGIMVDFIDSGYVIDQINGYKVSGHRYRLDCDSRSCRTGGADGTDGWGIDPAMEAVKVWIAPSNGTITVRDTIRMQPDRTGGLERSRYADGVRYSVQLNRGVYSVGNHTLSCTSAVRINALSSTLGPFDTVYTYRDTTFSVTEGDILFFRLQSGKSRLFDRVDWRHGITYTGNVSSDPDQYGKPGNKYVSSEDFVVEGSDFFQAPADGRLILDIDVSTGNLQSGTTHNGLTIRTQYNNYTYQDSSIAEGQNHLFHMKLYGSPTVINSINRGDSVKVWILNGNLQQTTWGNVDCTVHYRFVPNANASVTDTLDYWIAPSIPSLWPVIQTAQNNLFGPIYRGWGQFGYMADGTSANDVIPLSSLHCGKTVDAGNLDTNNMKLVGNHIDPDDLTFNSISSALTVSGNYNPLSVTAESRWRRMDADCRNKAWLGYGRTTVLTRGTAANVCPQEFFAEGEAAEAMDMDCPATAPTQEYPKVKTHARYSESRTDNFSFSADIGVTAGTSFSNGYSNTLADYVDLNGDRYPDLLGESAVQLTMPYGGLESSVRDILGQPSETDTRSAGASVAPGDNTQRPKPMFGKVSAAAKSESVPDRALSLSGSLVSGCDTVRSSYLDINGDGLPDKVYDDGNVGLNVGYRFLSPEMWKFKGVHEGSYISGSGSTPLKPPFNLEKFSVGGGRSIGLSDNRTIFQLADINGDGLPDRILRNSTDNNLVVYINLGAGNWDEINVDVEEISHGTSFNESVNMSVTTGFTLGFAKVNASVNGTPKGRNFSCEKVQITDIDGDGFPDYVTSNAENKMRVRYNTLGRVGQLVGVHNFNNATFTMDYEFISPTYEQPQGQWVLSECRVVGDVAKGIQDTYTTYSYRNPHYDRYERMSFGFDTVIACQHTTDASGSYIPYRFVTEGYHNNTYQKRGKKRSESISDADGYRWDETLYDIVVVDLESGDTVGDSECPLVSYPLLEKTVTNHYEGHAAPQMITAKSFIYDNYRNVNAYINWGDTNRTGDEMRADMSYLTGQPRNMVSLRSDVTVRGGRLTTAPLMRKSEFTYDAAGGLASKTDYITGSATAITDYLRDVYGNVTQVTLPENTAGQRMWYSYEYDPVLHRLPIQTDDAYGRTSTASYRYCYGKPASVTDVAGNTVRYTYDTLGRVLTVTAPRELQAGIPYTWKAEYSGGWWARTSHYDILHPNDPIETMIFCDSWGRIAQVKKDIEENGSVSVQVSGRTGYDALGRAVRQYDPTSESPGTPYNYNVTATPLRTETEYDILDRTVQSTAYLGSIPLVQTSSFAYTATPEGTMMLTTATDPLNRSTTSLTDAHGRTVSVTDAEGGTTKYLYDALGQLLQSIDPEGFQTSYAYDLLGRATQRRHPDAGLTTTDYDPVGNVIQQTNAAGETVTYTYDFLRPTHKHYSRLLQNDVYYNYNAAGQVSRIQDGSGVQFFFYDALGNVSKNVRTFAVPFSNSTYTFTMEYEYDSWGRMLKITYPDGEKVDYGYDLGGSLYEMHGTKGNDNYDYINRIHYDLFGNRTEIEYGDRSRTEYVYDELQRLSSLTTNAYNAGVETVIQDIKYTFDDVGNITDATNSAAAFGTMGGPYTNIYDYDDIDRLRYSTQSYGSGNALTATYSPSGRMCSREQTRTGRDDVFGYIGTNKPHAPRRILDRNGGTLHDLLWDNSGNLAQTGLYVTASGSYISGRYLFWTEDSRLTNVVDDKWFSYYAYDHGGERVLKMTGINTVLDINAYFFLSASQVDKITLYASPYLVANSNGYTKHYYAGTERICARLGNGGLDRNGNFLGQNPELVNKVTNLYNGCISYMGNRDLEANDILRISSSCGTTPPKLAREVDPTPTSVHASAPVMVQPFNNAMTLYANVTQQGEDPFFYHSDHLGSASWITDRDGIPVQHLQYLPFGESFVDQHTSGYKERFTFTGKEKDYETGYYNFGARYYDPVLSGLFLSVDPMSDKYPSLSPYAYCAWNPIKLVDPDGKDWYDLLSNGTLIRNDEKSKNYQEYDVIYSLANKSLSDKMTIGTLSEQTKANLNGYEGSKMILGGNRKDNVTAFMFCADNSNVEFSLMEFEYGEIKSTYLTTSHDTRSIDKPSTDNYGSEFAKERSLYLVSHLHNHIGSASPSGGYDENGNLIGDLGFRDAINRRRGTSDTPLPNVLWGIYKCSGNNKYTKDYEGKLIDPTTMQPL